MCRKCTHFVCVQTTASTTGVAKCSVCCPHAQHPLHLSSEPPSKVTLKDLGRLMFLKGKHKITRVQCGLTTAERALRLVHETCVPPTTCRPPPAPTLVTCLQCGTQLGSRARGTSWFARSPVTQRYLYHKATVFLFKLNLLPLFFKLTVSDQSGCAFVKDKTFGGLKT